MGDQLINGVTPTHHAMWKDLMSWDYNLKCWIYEYTNYILKEEIWNKKLI